MIRHGMLIELSPGMRIETLGCWRREREFALAPFFAGFHAKRRAHDAKRRAHDANEARKIPLPSLRSRASPACSLRAPR
jgi:hypothetical protein